MSDNPPDLNVVEMAAEIVSAYVRNNSIPVSDLPALLQSVHEALGSIMNGPKPEAVKEPPQPKVPIKKSITNDYIICLEDGKRFKSLKRHLQSAYGLSPQEYREKWGLPKDYPMVAPSYADARSNLAKTMGLGRKAGAAAQDGPARDASAGDALVEDAPAMEMPEPELDLPEPPEPTAAEPEPVEPESVKAEPAKAEPEPARAEEPAKGEEPVKKPRRGRVKATA